MARKSRQKIIQKDNGTLIYEEKCKVCNSHFKSLIEDLSSQGMKPRQIYDYLKSLTDPEEKTHMQREQLNESCIRRHLAKHYNLQIDSTVKAAETKARLFRSRDAFKHGVRPKIDSIATIAHMIDIALINIEDLDSMPDGRQKHQLVINYMATIKNLVDEFSKLTGELKQEGTIDINFFNTQITEFANIVLTTVKKLDSMFNLHSQLEYAFAKEFQKQWKDYKDIQTKMVSGELPLTYGEKERNVNSYNDISQYEEVQNTGYIDTEKLDEFDDDFPEV